MIRKYCIYILYTICVEITEFDKQMNEILPFYNSLVFSADE